MKMRYLLLILAFCFSIVANAQSKALFVAVESQKKKGEALNGQKFDLGYRAGFATIHKNESWIFKAEISAAYKGAKFNLNETHTKVREFHVGVNFNAQLRVKKLFSIGGGAFITPVFGQKQDAGLFIRDVTNKQGSDMGVVGIVGKEIGRYLIEFRYKKGLFDTNEGVHDVKTEDLCLNLFYLF